MNEAEAELFRRNAGGLLEGDTETVRALIAAHARDDFDLIISLGEQAFLADGNFQFNIAGDNGQSYRARASTDVTLTPIISAWTQIRSGTFGGSPVSFIDTQATNYSQRFYVITVP